MAAGGGPFSPARRARAHRAAPARAADGSARRRAAPGRPADRGGVGALAGHPVRRGRDGTGLVARVCRRLLGRPRAAAHVGRGGAGGGMRAGDRGAAGGRRGTGSQAARGLPQCARVDGRRAHLDGTSGWLAHARRGLFGGASAGERAGALRSRCQKEIRTAPVSSGVLRDPRAADLREQLRGVPRPQQDEGESAARHVCPGAGGGASTGR